MCNVLLPAGLLDGRVEIFAVAPFKVKCLHEGRTCELGDLPAEMIDMLKHELSVDLKAIKGLKLLGITNDEDMLQAYNHCKRGSFDKVADISGHVLTSEQYDCGMRGRCVAEGMICKPLLINGEHLTQRETQCLRLIGKGLSYKEIQSEFNYKSVVSANSLVQRLYGKVGASDKAKVALLAAQVFNL